MAYKRRTYKKKNTASFKKKVLKVVKGVAETKHFKTEKIVDITTADLPGDKSVAVWDTILTDNIPIGAGVANMSGEYIYITGIRLEIAYDNTDIEQGGPLYITTLVLHNKGDQNIFESLFNVYDNTVGTNSGLGTTNARKLTGSTTDLVDETATPDDNDGHRQLAPTKTSILSNADVFVHSSPINKGDYTVYHRSALRLGCKLQPDMPGPRYHQRIVYIPINKKVHCLGSKISADGKTILEMSCTQRIHLAFIVFNFT